MSRAYKWDVWLAQAEHDAEVAGVLAERRYWADAIFHAVEAIEKTLKAMDAKRWTYGEMEIPYGELEQHSYGDLGLGKRPPQTHKDESLAGPGHKKFWPDTLTEEIRHLEPNKLRNAVRYPRGPSPKEPPFKLYGELQYREVERAMTAVLERARAALPPAPPGP